MFEEGLHNLFIKDYNKTCMPKLKPEKQRFKVQIFLPLYNYHKWYRMLESINIRLTLKYIQIPQKR